MAKGKFNGIQANVDAAAVDTNILPDLPEIADTDKIVIVSEKRAGKTVVAIDKTEITFDAEGKAEVNGKVAKYLLTIPGYNLVNADKGKTKAVNADAEKPAEETAKVSDEAEKPVEPETAKTGKGKGKK